MILSSNKELAINDSIFRDTYLLIGLAPKSESKLSSIMYSLALSVKDKVNCLSLNLSSIFLIILFNIS